MNITESTLTRTHGEKAVDTRSLSGFWSLDLKASRGHETLTAHPFWELKVVTLAAGDLEMEASATAYERVKM